MRESPADTIVAPATAPAPAALAVVRLSGPRAWEIGATLLGRPLEPRQALYGWLRHGGQWIDDAVVTAWRGPRSPTGEDVVELSIHGSPCIVDLLLAASHSLGARPAGPGEFTRRAFLNGRLDLTQAEAVMDLVLARSERALRAARALQRGSLRDALAAHRETLLSLLAHLEAFIDFPEEDIDPDTGAVWMKELAGLEETLRTLLATAEEGRLLREGVTVVLAGEPNAGKSSLLNALLTRDRAIVSPTPGTTRDTVEEMVLWEGVAVRLVDTAGLRETRDDVERLGVERTWEALQRADLVVHVIDSTLPPPAAPAWPGDVPVIPCRTKCDLAAGPGGGEGWSVSAVTGEGLTALKGEICRRLRLGASCASLDHVAVNDRQAHHLQEALHALSRARAACAEQAPIELAGADLRHALFHLGEISSPAGTEEVLDVLFQRFCIGK